MKIAFIGSGNMGEALIATIIKSNRDLIATDIKKERLRYISNKYKIETTDNNKEAVRKSNIVFLCVKPQTMETVLNEIKDCVDKNKVVVSIAAGITTKFIEKYLSKTPVVKIMPNIPISVNEGVIAICKGKRCRDSHIFLVKKLLRNGGKIIEVKEEEMSIITALSGSGPAYLFYFAECMIDAAMKFGLKSEKADLLVRQTLFGASKVLIERGGRPEKFRQEVSSPGGTTEAAIKYLENKKFRSILFRAIDNARLRAEELKK